MVSSSAVGTRWVTTTVAKAKAASTPAVRPLPRAIPAQQNAFKGQNAAPRALVYVEAVRVMPSASNLGSATAVSVEVKSAEKTPSAWTVGNALKAAHVSKASGSVWRSQHPAYPSPHLVVKAAPVSPASATSTPHAVAKAGTSSAQAPVR